MPERSAKRHSLRFPAPSDNVSMLSAAMSSLTSTTVCPTPGGLGGESPLMEVVERALCEGPVPFVPLLLYGSNNSGLREWLRGLLESAQGRKAWSSPLVLAGKEFARAVGLAVTTDSLAEFRERLRNHDLIVIEQLEPMAEDAPTSRELCGLIETREADGGALIITTPRLPTHLHGYPPSLSSRLIGGLSVPITSPPLRWRRETMRAALGDVWDQFDEQLRETWLETSVSTVDEWESLLSSLVQRVQDGLGLSADLMSPEPSSKDATETIDPILIAKTVAAATSLRLSDLKGSSRRRSTVLARSIAIYLIREWTGLSLEAIGQLFGHRDHTTVLHAYRKIAESRRIDPPTSHLIEVVCHELNLVPPPLS